MINHTDYIMHVNRGWTKPGHKYISRYLKNGKWQYVYKSTVNKIRDAARYAKNTDGKQYDVGGYSKEKEYITFGKNGPVNTREVARRGNSWLSKKVITGSGKNQTVYNEHGIIRQAAESAINRGSAFIDALRGKKKR